MMLLYYLSKIAIQVANSVDCGLICVYTVCSGLGENIWSKNGT